MLYQSIQSCDLIVSAYMQTLMTVIDLNTYPNACIHLIVVKAKLFGNENNIPNSDTGRKKDYISCFVWI